MYGILTNKLLTLSFNSLRKVLPIPRVSERLSLITKRVKREMRSRGGGGGVEVPRISARNLSISLFTARRRAGEGGGAGGGGGARSRGGRGGVARSGWFYRSQGKFHPSVEERNLHGEFMLDRYY